MTTTVEAPTGVQFKSVQFDTKAVADKPDDDGFVYIEAYASAFGNVDSHGDIIVKGAFAESLKSWAEKGAPIPSFYNHGLFSGDPTDNVGFLSVAQEDEKGLRVVVALDVGHNAKAAYLHRLIKQGRLRELSVGYIAKAWEYIKGEDDWHTGRKFTELDLLEVSLVTVASNSLATVVEKASALLYGDTGKAAAKADPDPEGDGDAPAEGDDEPEDNSAAIAALDAAIEKLTEARDELAASEGDEDEDGDQPAESEEGTDEPVGVKGLSARARVALALAAVGLTAETE